MKYLHTVLNSISPKSECYRAIGSDLAYIDVKIQHVNNYSMEIPLEPDLPRDLISAM